MLPISGGSDNLPQNQESSQTTPDVADEPKDKKDEHESDELFALYCSCPEELEMLLDLRTTQGNRAANECLFETLYMKTALIDDALTSLRVQEHLFHNRKANALHWTKEDADFKST